MKKIIVQIIFVQSIIFSLYAAPGCMDTSLHAYACNDGARLCSLRPYDNKELHYVPCTCPCEEYAIYNKRGKCSRCWHYHDPEYDIVDNVKEFEYGTDLAEVFIERASKEKV